VLLKPNLANNEKKNVKGIWVTVDKSGNREIMMRKILQDKGKFRSLERSRKVGNKWGGKISVKEGN
jgi:hypothetical protein